MELEGDELDAAVAEALGWHMHLWSKTDWDWRTAPDESDADDIGELQAASDWSPSTDWAEGGPIIESEKIQLLFQNSETGPREWWAKVHGCPETHVGSSPLVAAMRAFVASKSA